MTSMEDMERCYSFALSLYVCVIGGKHIAILLHSGEIAINILVAYYDIHGEMSGAILLFHPGHHTRQFMYAMNKLVNICIIFFKQANFASAILTYEYNANCDITFTYASCEIRVRSAQNLIFNFLLLKIRPDYVHHTYIHTTHALSPKA
jgi:hypothetical protein